MGTAITGSIDSALLYDYHRLMTIKSEHRARFFVGNPYPKERVIFTEFGPIEMGGVVILILCVMRLIQLSYMSVLKISRYFWLASTLVFLTVIRRELSFLSDIWVPKGFTWLGHDYDWWEDGALVLMYVIALGLLIYARRYIAAVMKQTPIILYVIVALLIGLQYLGEHHIVFPAAMGVMVEELAEGIIYAIALVYLLRFDLSTVRQQLMPVTAKQQSTHHSTNL